MVQRFNNTSPEKQEYIDNELNIGFSLPMFLQPVTIDLQQITLDVIPQLWVAVPAEEAVNDPGWQGSGRLHVSKLF
jgi:hypothetical protein